MYYTLNAYISAKMWTSALVKAYMYLWNTTNGKGTVAEPLMGVKDAGNV